MKWAIMRTEHVYISFSLIPINCSFHLNLMTGFITFNVGWAAFCLFNHIKIGVIFSAYKVIAGR